MPAIVEDNQTFQAALKLADYLIQNHWTGNTLIGPDPGIRFEFRIWRFLKYYFPWFDYKDDRYFLQCQGYWIINCWKLHEMTGEGRYRDLALRCTEDVLRRQTGEGYWHYPLPEWKDKIATVEGCYGSLGLLHTYRYTREASLLKAVLKWYDFMVNQTGFVHHKKGICVNYFYKIGNVMIPNNATLMLFLIGEISDLTEDPKYLEYQDATVRFLEFAQRDSGELPYVYLLPGQHGRDHLLCYQYNAFQFLDMARNYEITGDEKLSDILKKLACYLVSGITRKNSSKYMCHKSNPEIYYYSAVMAAAFLRATQLGLGDYQAQSDAIYAHVLSKQNASGRFPHSQNSYLILRDGRSYPRYQCMILKHLLMRAESQRPVARMK